MTARLPFSSRPALSRRRSPARVAVAVVLLGGAAAAGVTAVSQAQATTAPIVPVVTVSAPATAISGLGLTLTGTVTGLPPDALIDYSKTDAEDPAGRLLGRTSFDASGEFSLSVAPMAGGRITYTLTTPAMDGYAVVSASTTVTVPYHATTLTLIDDKDPYWPNDRMHITATLGATYRNRTVEIWADPYGADQPPRLLTKAAVNGYGILGTFLTPTRNTLVTAKFTGDTRYAARSATTVVSTRAAVNAVISKHYKTGKIGSNTYYYFRTSKDPRITVTMTAYPKRKQRLVVQRYSAGAWKSWRAAYYPLSAAGKSSVDVKATYAAKARYRVRAEYVTGGSGDSANYTTYGSWKYFTFTK